MLLGEARKDSEEVAVSVAVAVWVREAVLDSVDAEDGDEETELCWELVEEEDAPMVSVAVVLAVAEAPGEAATRVSLT